MKENLTSVRLIWDGEPTEEEFEKFEECKALIKELGIELELIGSRPKDRG